MSKEIPEPSDWEFLRVDEFQDAKDTAKMAGEYIESIGKTDLAEFTKDEFETLLLVICNDFNSKRIPF